METENKLEEAQYFFNRMKENISNPKVLGFNLSAFINAARSVNWIMQKEYSDNRRFKSWYVSKRKDLEADKVCKFFHNLRTANIHLESPKFKRDIAVNLRDNVHISDSLGVKVIRDGKIILDSSSKVPEMKTSNTNPTSNQSQNNSINIKMFFEEKLKEDGIFLCEYYLSKMSDLVSELLNKIQSKR